MVVVDVLLVGVGVDDVPSLFSRGGRDDPSTSSSESDGEVLADIGLGDDDSTMANPNRRESPNPIGRPLTTNARDFPKAGRDPNR